MAQRKRDEDGGRLRVAYEGRTDGVSHGSWALVNERLRRPLAKRVELTMVAPHGPPPEGGADVWLSHYYPGLEPNPAFLAPPTTGGRWVCWVAWELGPVPHEWVDDWRAGRVAEVWACSAHARRLILASSDLDPAKVRVMPYGVDTAVFSPEGPRWIVAKEEVFRVLYVGGALPRKGVDVAISAYGRAFDDDEPTRLVLKLQGVKSFYAPAPAVAAPIGRHDFQVVDGDKYSDEQMAGLYRSVGALVAPYRAEGFCLPLLEAMACGLPVVYPSHGPGPEYCPPEAGIRVPSPGGAPDPADVARALRWLWRHPEERARMGAAGRHAALSLAWAQRAVAVEGALQLVALGHPAEDAFAAPASPSPTPPGPTRGAAAARSG